MIISKNSVPKNAIIALFLALASRQPIIPAIESTRMKIVAQGIQGEINNQIHD
jgi:hypothetical protein